MDNNNDNNPLHAAAGQLYVAAGQSGLLKYACQGCQCEIFSRLPVNLTCQDCDEILVGKDIV